MDSVGEGKPWKWEEEEQSLAEVPEKVEEPVMGMAAAVQGAFLVKEVAVPMTVEKSHGDQFLKKRKPVE